MGKLTNIWAEGPENRITKSFLKWTKLRTYATWFLTIFLLFSKAIIINKCSISERVDI